jgi:hypothetical protein
MSDLTAITRMTAALSDSSAVFNRTQLAWFMAQAMRWGYETAADESYWQGHADGIASVVELNLDALSAARAAAPFSGRESADALAKRRRAAAADAGLLDYDVPAPVRLPDCEWPAVAEVPA